MGERWFTGADMMDTNLETVAANLKDWFQGMGDATLLHEGHATPPSSV